MQQNAQPLNLDATRIGYPIFSAEQVAQWPPVSWLIDGVIQRTSSVLLYGESRIGKSFFTLDLACKLAAGETWFGCARRPNSDHPCRLNLDQGWKPSPRGSACG